jgi:hypothetical protein
MRRSDVSGYLGAEATPVESNRVAEHAGPAASASFVGRIRLWLPAPIVTRLVLAVGLVVTFLFVAFRVDERWVPEDEGLFGQTALRVLAGELPHRDFGDAYTGGLTFLNAALFGLLGENLLWLRLPLVLLFPAYAACVYSIARRFVATPVAALVVLLTVGWGLVLYPAAMPSWYLLYLAVFGAASVLRYLDTRRDRWLVVAGLLGGLSVTIKVTGVWYVLAVVLFLVFVEQESRGQSRSGWRLGGYGVLVTGLAVAVVGLAASIVAGHPGAAELYNLLLPLVAVCAALVVNEGWVPRVAGPRERIVALSRLALPFLAGVAAPVLVYSVPYAVAGGLDDLVQGVLVAPQVRLEQTNLGTPAPVYALVALPLVLVLIARRGVRPWLRRLFDVAFVVLLVVVMVRAADTLGYWLLWHSARSGAPLIPILGVVALLLLRRRNGDLRDRRPAMLLLLLAALAAQSQFPYAESIYFCYALPLFALAALAVASYAGIDRGLLPIALLVTFVVFGFVGLVRSPQSLGRHYHGPKPLVVLESSRASIRVPPADRVMYRRIVALLREHSAGAYAYAGPDTPELYYLADLRNPTRTVFDFLDDTGASRGHQLLDALRSHGVTAIAIDSEPAYSDPHGAEVLAALRTRYPHVERVDRFEVRWR